MITDTDRIDYLSMHWNSQGEGHHIMGRFLPNPTGSFRNAIDADINAARLRQSSTGQGKLHQARVDSDRADKALSPEEVLAFKIAEHALRTNSLSLAVANLLRRARKVGKSGVRKLVLTADLDELERQIQQVNSIKWLESWI